MNIESVKRLFSACWCCFSASTGRKEKRTREKREEGRALCEAGDDKKREQNAKTMIKRISLAGWLDVLDAVELISRTRWKLYCLSIRREDYDSKLKKERSERNARLSLQQRQMEFFSAASGGAARIESFGWKESDVKGAQSSSCYATTR